MEIEGKEIGRYRVLRLIGHGANGDVYLAEDPRIEQQVAIKIFQNEPSPTAEVGAGNTLVVFRDETRAIDRLKHPRIVHLNYYDEATIEGKSILYIVTPYYKDGSLSRWLQRRGANPLSLEDITHLISQAADALQYAHNFQIVHRHVKPSNFLIDTEGITNPNRPNLLLTDFGITTSTSTNTEDAGQVSSGVLAYIAPEQINARAIFASDQYALAIIAYELLTGYPPFQGTPTVIMRQHLENQPEPPSSVNANIPKAIDNVILRALAKRPEDRFGSVKAFSTAFQRGSGLGRPPGESIHAPTGPADAGGPGDLPGRQSAGVPPMAPRGQDIHTTLVISPGEAQQGTKRTRHLGARDVPITVPPNAYNGMVMQLEGQGEPSPAGGAWGNLYVTINVAAYQQRPTPTPPLPQQSLQVPPSPIYQPYQQVPPGQLLPSQTRTIELSHEYLRFIAFYPKLVLVGMWNTLLVYAHIESALQAVRTDAAKFKEEMGPIPGKASAQASLPLARGIEITIVPTCQGVTFNPERVLFKWVEDWHQIKFRFQADRRLAGLADNGEVIIYAGPLIIATLKMALLFEEQSLPPPEKNYLEVATTLYKQIFVSYSHSDTPIVLACRNAYKALGFDVLIDIDTLRSGQIWNPALMMMIDTSDIFQLFWSPHSAQSQFVRQEWQYALQHAKGEGFIRPVYWKKPLIPPPDDLSKLHFEYIQLPKLETPEYRRKFNLRFFSIFRRQK